VAAALGLTRRRVQAMIAAGHLRAERFGRDWLIRPAALEAVRVRRPGRPAGRRAGPTTPPR
jgi:excisionase family DNA binding protein